jgi:hypothetical protein
VSNWPGSNLQNFDKVSTPAIEVNLWALNYFILFDLQFQLLVLCFSFSVNLVSVWLCRANSEIGELKRCELSDRKWWNKSYTICYFQVVQCFRSRKQWSMWYYQCKWIFCAIYSLGINYFLLLFLVTSTIKNPGIVVRLMYLWKIWNAFISGVWLQTCLSALDCDAVHGVQWSRTNCIVPPKRKIQEYW